VGREGVVFPLSPAPCSVLVVAFCHGFVPGPRAGSHLSAGSATCGGLPRCGNMPRPAGAAKCPKSLTRRGSTPIRHRKAAHDQRAVRLPRHDGTDSARQQDMNPRARRLRRRRRAHRLDAKTAHLVRAYARTTHFEWLAARPRPLFPGAPADDLGAQAAWDAESDALWARAQVDATTLGAARGRIAALVAARTREGDEARRLVAHEVRLL